MIKVELIDQLEKKTVIQNIKSVSVLVNKIADKLKDKTANSTIEIFLVTKERIREINNEFRQIDKATNVLAFPLNSTPSAEEKILGTLFISPEIAKEKGETLEELVEHGTLHLFSFDHEKKPKEWGNIEKIINGVAPTPRRNVVGTESRLKRREG